jgi:hypothetical protein
MLAVALAPVALVVLLCLRLWVCSWTFDVSLGFARLVLVMVGAVAIELLPLLLALVAVVVVLLLRRCLLRYMPSLK